MTKAFLTKTLEREYSQIGGDTQHQPHHPGTYCEEPKAEYQKYELLLGARKGKILFDDTRGKCHYDRI